MSNLRIGCRLKVFSDLTYEGVLAAVDFRGTGVHDTITLSRATCLETGVQDQGLRHFLKSDFTKFEILREDGAGGDKLDIISSKIPNMAVIKEPLLVGCQQQRNNPNAVTHTDYKDLLVQSIYLKKGTGNKSERITTGENKVDASFQEASSDDDDADADSDSTLRDDVIIEEEVDENEEDSTETQQNDNAGHQDVGYETHLITTLNKSFHDALSVLNEEEMVGLAVEGRSIGRFGQLSTVQLSLRRECYIFDIVSLDAQVKGSDAGCMKGADAGCMKGADAGCMKVSDAGCMKGSDAGCMKGADAGCMKVSDAGCMKGSDAGCMKGADAGCMKGADAGCMKYLKPLLESSDTRKIVYNCRGLSDLLFHQYDILLNNIFDCQVADINHYHVEMNVIPRYTSCLAATLLRVLHLHQDQVHFPRFRASNKQQDESVWFERPITAEMTEAACKDVRYLMRLYYAQKRDLMDSFIHDVDIYLRSWKSLSNEQYDTFKKVPQGRVPRGVGRDPVGKTSLSVAPRRDSGFVDGERRVFGDNCARCLDPLIKLNHDSISHSQVVESGQSSGRSRRGGRPHGPGVKKRSRSADAVHRATMALGDKAGIRHALSYLTNNAAKPTQAKLLDQF